MRNAICLVVLLLAGCATTMPKGGWTKEGAKPREMSKDWDDCYGHPYAGLVIAGPLGRSAQRRQAEDCMRERGWK